MFRDPARSKYAAYYLAPFAALAIWFSALWHTTGYLFGDPGFTHYNIAYSLNPVRASVALLRRLFYLFIADFRWVGSLAILFAWRRAALYSTRAWKIVWCFIAAHIVLVSLLGGADVGTLPAARSPAGVYRDGRGLSSGASALALPRRGSPGLLDFWSDSS